MREFRLREEDDHIKLGQFMKAANLVSSGSEAKALILNGDVKVNGEVCLMRGKKLKSGDRVSFSGKEVVII